MKVVTCFKYLRVNYEYVLCSSYLTLTHGQTCIMVMMKIKKNAITFVNNDYLSFQFCKWRVLIQRFFLNSFRLRNSKGLQCVLFC